MKLKLEKIIEQIKKNRLQGFSLKPSNFFCFWYNRFVVITKTDPYSKEEIEKNKVLLGSLAMDLKRVAMGYYSGSFVVADRFFDEALKRKEEIKKTLLKPYLVEILKDMDNLRSEQDKMKRAEDALMYSTLFQNAALK